jgi:hypothetical protein
MTEVGGGVPSGELRDRLVDRFLAKPIPTHWMSTRTSWGNDVVDAILAEIAAAGYELVPADRLERLRRIAEWTEKTPAIAADVCRPMAMPGDLDRLGGGE